MVCNLSLTDSGITNTNETTTETIAVIINNRTELGTISTNSSTIIGWKQKTITPETPSGERTLPLMSLKLYNNIISKNRGFNRKCG